MRRATRKAAGVRTAATIAALLTMTLASPAFAASCRNTGSFEHWLAGFKKDALAKGISPQVLAAAEPDLTFDPGVIKKDRGQAVFSQSFLTFSDRMISKNRLIKGEAEMKKHAQLFARIEKDFGVPAPVLTAFWGLESDFGAITGNFRLIRSLATLAYDCRRSDFFRDQLLDALRIVQRGDQTMANMSGSWAGEFGGMQITSSDTYKNALDYDGDGHRDVIKSTADTVATAAHFLQSLGWKRGEPWLQEVRIPQTLQWDQADLTIQHPRSQWVAWGVRAAHGQLPADTLPASLLLPMGRHGPAFLAYPNFQAFLGWNSAFVYSTTVAYFATRLSGAPPVSRGSPDIAVLSPQQVMELQRELNRIGYDVGDIDGKVGSATRAAVKKAQMKVGLPADSYPTAELIERLRKH